MGVINLGLLVTKIKRKLENSGFIKNTDYATASAAGVVKVGEGLAITDAGVLSASGGSSGVTADLLFSGNIVNGTDVVRELAHPYTDYVALIFCCVVGVNELSGGILVCDAIQTGTYNSNNVSCGSLSDLRFDAEDATKFTVPGGTGTVTGVRIYGIK